MGAKCTIMMYRLTGSSKSHTMFGCLKQPGIVYKSVKDILGDKENGEEQVGMFVQVSVLEIYNEEIYDLLSCDKSGGSFNLWSKGSASKVKLEVMGKKAKNATFISGNEARKILKEIQKVEKRRIVRSTNCNDRRTRSHCMIILDAPTVGQVGFEAKMQVIAKLLFQACSAILVDPLDVTSESMVIFFLEERLCYRVLKYDIEAERLTRSSPGATKVHSRTRLLTVEELLEQLPALQQLLFRLMGCQVLKESFKIYCAINDGIINLVDMFFDMTKHDPVKALNIYKSAGQQAEFLADFYEYSKRLDLARNFQFPTLRLPPPSFLATMEEYVKEASHSGSVAKRLEYQEKNESPHKIEEPKIEQNQQEEELEEPEEEPEPQ